MERRRHSKSGTRRRHRKRCPNCDRPNEERLTNCYFCNTPLKQKGQFWDRVKDFFINFGGKN